jgi:hypothetical protein
MEVTKTIKVKFNGLASGTTADTEISYTLVGDDTEKYISNTSILEEAKTLYNEANNFAQLKTVEKATKR